MPSYTSYLPCLGSIVSKKHFFFRLQLSVDPQPRPWLALIHHRKQDNYSKRDGDKWLGRCGGEEGGDLERERRMEGKPGVGLEKRN